MKAIGICLWTSFLLAAVTCQRYPEIPCPNVFKYVSDNTGISGQVQVQNDYSGNYELQVNVSVATLLRNQNIKLNLLTSIDALNNGANPVYRVVFPVQNILPKVTQIVFNGRMYCRGSSEPVTSAGVTNMWASTILRTNIIPTQNSYYQQNYPNNNLPNNNPNNNLPNNNLPNNNSPNNNPSYNTNPFLQPSFPTKPTNQVLDYPIPLTPSNVRPTSPSVRPTQSRPTQSRPAPSPVRPTPSPIRPSGVRPSFGKPTPASQTNPPASAPFTSNSRPTGNPAVIERTEAEQCGVFSQQLIVGGEDVEKGQFPWLVAIFQRLVQHYEYRCTGNLITSRHVVSAGHCFKFQDLTSPKEDFTMVLGKQNIYNWAVGSTTRGISEIFIHESYKRNTGDNDIAIVKLDEPVEFSSKIKPVCLWSPADTASVTGQTGTVVGWGTDGETDYTPRAKKIDLSITSNEVCLRSHWGFINITSERTFCAGGKGVGPCSGDSGAGLIMKRKGLWTLRGVVSQALQAHGTVVCDLGQYIVFADVKSFVPWIQQTMKK